MDLSIKIGYLSIRNPLLIASGILGSSSLLAKRVFNEGAGGIVIKSTGLKARDGYPGPNVIQTPCGVLNAMGLPNPGAVEMVEEIQNLKKANIPVIASVYGFSTEEYVKTSQVLADAGVDALELNLSCPTVQETGDEIGVYPSKVREIIKAVKTTLPETTIIAKLSPNVSNIQVIGKAAEEGGADGVAAINTIKGMAIDINLQKPILHSKTGGLSGPAIRPIAVRAIYELYKNLRIPIIGCGGISSWQDVIEFFLAGAVAVQIGTGILYDDLKIFKHISDGISHYMQEKKLTHLQPLIGKAHE
jgi:dihydroorotate dehydrogenase (NAD+) catalytic subunit